MLGPRLQHNREAFDRLNSRKKQTAVLGLLGSVVMFVIVPNERILQVWLPLFGAVIAVFLWLEYRKLQVFRRDLREQREGKDGAMPH